MSLPITRCEGRCQVCHEQHHELQIEVERLKDKLEIETGACEFNRVAYAQCREERSALQQQVSALREAMKEAMDELYPATGYRAMNAFGILNAALAVPSHEPAPEVKP